MKTTPLRLEERLGKFLKQCGKTISVAESCTGGLISHRITNVPGSSEYYERGVVSYSNQSKISILLVSSITLNKFGAVSRQTAEEMARGIRQISGTDLGIATTGIAGPGGGSTEKPVGLVYICLSSKEKTICRRFTFEGSREEIKMQTSEAALRIVVNHLLSILKSKDGRSEPQN